MDHAVANPQEISAPLPSPTGGAAPAAERAPLTPWRIDTSCRFAHRPGRLVGYTADRVGRNVPRSATGPYITVPSRDVLSCPAGPCGHPTLRDWLTGERV